MLKHISPWLEKISRRQDIVLAVFMVSVIFMLVIPLPTGLVDALIALNMSIAVILLMVTMYLPSPLAFAAFPSVLLISTLFRLALSISTTRLILLQADAGEIIQTFGEFVVGGNIIVGLVVFLILTIVQFVVITKGAERVAEVSARFSLDALPGKQLSIDADMRAGAISLEEARHMRSQVQKESKLYGSMDGAMKFVKGDAIASIIIVFVNLIGGLAIGTLQRGFDFADAVHVYSILSIGDGLVAQIPALFVSITAGIMVTRVSDESEKTNLGNDIGKQVSAQPKALLVTSAMLLVFALVPGFPSGIFVTLSLLLGVPCVLLFLVARRSKRSARVSESLGSESQENLGARIEKKGEGVFSASRDPIFSPTVPLLVELPASMRAQGDVEDYHEKINQIRLTLYYRLGVPLPVIDLRFNAELEEDRYRIFVGEIPTADGKLRHGHLFIVDRMENLDLFHIPFERDDPFLPNHESVWVNESYRGQLDSAEIRFKESFDLVRYHCELVVAKYVSNFIGIQEAKFLLMRMESEFPDLVKEVQRVMPIQGIAELFRRLVQEFVSIRDLRQILSAITEWGAKEKDPIMLVEHIRSSLSRQISYQYSVGYNILPAILLDGEIEETIRNAVRQTSVASYIALDPDISDKIVDRIRQVAGENLPGKNQAVLITTMDIRRYVRRLIEGVLPELPVLSYQEVTPEITLQPLGKVTIN